MTACFGIMSHHSIRAYSMAPIKPRRVRFSAVGLACVVGAAVVAFASIALAQPAGDRGRSGLGGSQSARPLSAIQASNTNVRTKSTAAAAEFYNVPAVASSLSRAL